MDRCTNESVTAFGNASKRKETVGEQPEKKKVKRNKTISADVDVTKDSCGGIVEGSLDATKSRGANPSSASADGDIVATPKKKKKKTKEEQNKKKHKKRLAAFIAANDFDEKCLRAISKLTDQQAKEVMRRATRAEVDTSKGSFSLLVTAMCKQERQAGKLKALEWPEQAGPERIEYNRLLRERYANNPEALTDVEMERAKVLLARDERKTNAKKGKGVARSAPK
mmetsp:Transcript_116862/g.184837  ORF Transcript_116862/g.184837 Transcript_116862/m.184837 type:complete len:225 (+) Transcript_116862:30-704(+)